MSEKQRFLACRAACYRRRSASYRRHPMASSYATVLPAFRLPSSRGKCFGDYCTKTRKGTRLSFWYKVYHAPVLLCSKFERDQLLQRGASRQKLLEASGRVGAILTTVASRGCPQCMWTDQNNHIIHAMLYHSLFSRNEQFELKQFVFWALGQKVHGLYSNNFCDHIIINDIAK